MEKNRTLACFGQWKVTALGIEAVGGPCLYEIGKGELGHVWWSDHMREKRWVNVGDFDKALDFARKYFGTKVDGGGILW